MIRAFGAELRNRLNRVGNRVAAAGAGTAVTVFLQSGTGETVKDRKQAVAIALSEAGASKYESDEKNRENLEGTRRRQCGKGH